MVTLFSQVEVAAIHDYNIKQESMAESIKSLMETLGFTARQAMEALRIPAEQHTDYLKLLEQS